MNGLPNRGFCPRCLPGEDAGGDALKKRLKTLIEALPEDARADDALAMRRLALCRDCRWLDGGLCGLCGCYVLYRAYQLRRNCPEGREGWNIAIQNS